jgi:DNA-binding NtrC family response regulator
MRILCVDDDPVIHQLFERSLKKLDLPDFQYLTTTSGEDAITIVGDSSVDLVLLDNILPDARGVDILSRIRAISPTTEVLMITGNASVSDAVKAMKGGARDYIEKPFHLELLREKIYNLIEIRQRSREVEDYRFAKEMVESGATREISTLEEAIDAMKQCQARVIAILESNRSDTDKLRDVRNEVIGIHGGCQ